MKQNVYTPIQQVRDKQPIRATCFHPSGETYVVGTNSKALKICKYPSRERIQELMGAEGDMDGVISESEISFTCLHIHCASVYCATFNQTGDLLASGSNDQVVHVIKYDREHHRPGNSEYKLNMHTGTVRDVCFLGNNDGDPLDSSAPSSSAMLLSAGCGQYEINLTDCNVMKQTQSFKSHKSTVMSLHSCREWANIFVSGSLDGMIKIWDVRCGDSVRNTSGDSNEDVNRSATAEQLGQENQKPASEEMVILSRQRPFTNPITPQFCHQQEDATRGASLTPEGVPVGAVRLDPSGRLLVSGHQDGSCMLHDVRADRTIQTFRVHEDQIRTVNFSPNCYYLLTGGYDRKIRLTDIQGHLTNPLPSIEVVEQDDKVVQTAWHPIDYNFVSTCADGSATLWTIPDFDEWRRDSMAAEI